MVSSSSARCTTPLLIDDAEWATIERGVALHPFARVRQIVAGDRGQFLQHRQPRRVARIVEHVRPGAGGRIAVRPAARVRPGIEQRGLCRQLHPLYRLAARL